MHYSGFEFGLTFPKPRITDLNTLKLTTSNTPQTCSLDQLIRYSCYDLEHIINLLKIKCVNILNIEHWM